MHNANKHISTKLDNTKIQINMNIKSNKHRDNELFTSHPSKPKSTASSARRSAYIWADSFVESNISQAAFPASHSVMKVPNT